MSVVLGGLKPTLLRSIKTSFIFGLWDGIAPLIGILIGDFLSNKIDSTADTIAAIGLGAYGLFIVVRALLSDEHADPDLKFATRGLPLPLSVDNVAAGASLGLLGYSPWIAPILFGTITFFMSVAGHQIGRMAAPLHTPHPHRPVDRDRVRRDGRPAGVWASRSPAATEPDSRRVSRSPPSTACSPGRPSGVDSSSSADSASLSNRASASSHEATAAVASSAAGRVEVVARADGGEPLLIAGEVGVGLLELGVRGPAAAALELELLVELPRALDHLVVLVGPLALHRVDDRGLLLGVRQAGCEASRRGRPPRAVGPRAAPRRAWSSASPGAGTRTAAGSGPRGCADCATRRRGVSRSRRAGWRR